jgi:transcriptional regulator with XRE-family HTH domain
MSETKSELGIPLRGLRSQKGSTLNKIKNGQMSPTCDALQKLAAGFAVNVSANAKVSANANVNVNVNAEGSPHAIL